VALALRAQGFTDIWVLKGGLNGWIRAGYPTEPVEPVEA
jgi:rhodanese-related sulfurtransferase